VEGLADDAVVVLHLVHHGKLDRRPGHRHLPRRSGPETGASAIVTAPPTAITEPTNAKWRLVVGRQARYSGPASWLE
jgi:hypothetical protein